MRRILSVQGFSPRSSPDRPRRRRIINLRPSSPVIRLLSASHPHHSSSSLCVDSVALYIRHQPINQAASSTPARSSAPPSPAYCQPSWRTIYSLIFPGRFLVLVIGIFNYYCIREQVIFYAQNLELFENAVSKPCAISYRQTCARQEEGDGRRGEGGRGGGKGGTHTVDTIPSHNNQSIILSIETFSAWET